MIPSKNQSNPKYSFGREARLPSLLTQKPKTDYLYNPPVSNNFKFDRVRNFIFKFYFLNLYFRDQNGNFQKQKEKDYMQVKDMNIIIINMINLWIKKILKRNGIKF